MLAGWAKEIISLHPQGLAMHGYGQAKHKAWRKRTELCARVILIQEVPEQAPLIFCCLELGYVTHAMRAAIVEHIRPFFGIHWDEARFVLTCTHTHSGPGGCAHEVLYNLVTPGFSPEDFQAVVEASVLAIRQAYAQIVPVDLVWTSAALAADIPVAWNRALQAYLRNPEAIPYREHERHLALDRQVRMLCIRQGIRTVAVLHLFGVHATCLGSGLNAYDADNKGYAARAFERFLDAQGLEKPAVAIFAQGTAGDVSPHFHGSGDLDRRQSMTPAQEVSYARRNGHLQAEHAQSLYDLPGMVCEGPIEARLAYADFSNVEVAPDFSDGHLARTTRPAHGVSFFAGTPVDGLGISAPLALVLRRLARQVRLLRGKVDADFYQAQGNKDVFLDAGGKRILGVPIKGLLRLPFLEHLDPVVGELRRQVRLGAVERSPLVPITLPIQYVRLGPIAFLACPGEFTTVAGQRLVATVRPILEAAGISEVAMLTYCNDYMGYVTTREEYAVQTYEGGHTVYGQWTLAAFQTLYQDILRTRPVRLDFSLRPIPVPEDELMLRSVQPSKNTPG